MFVSHCSTFCWLHRLLGYLHSVGTPDTSPEVLLQLDHVDSVGISSTQKIGVFVSKRVQMFVERQNCLWFRIAELLIGLFLQLDCT